MGGSSVNMPKKFVAGILNASNHMPPFLRSARPGGAVRGHTIRPTQKVEPLGLASALFRKLHVPAAASTSSTSQRRSRPERIFRGHPIALQPCMTRVRWVAPITRMHFSCAEIGVSCLSRDCRALGGSWGNRQCPACNSGPIRTSCRSFVHDGCRRDVTNRSTGGLGAAGPQVNSHSSSPLPHAFSDWRCQTATLAAQLH